MGHADADGICATGLLCRLLYDAGIEFRARLVPRLTEEELTFEDWGPSARVYLDLGSRPPAVPPPAATRLYWIDHHQHDPLLLGDLTEEDRERFEADGLHPLGRAFTAPLLSLEGQTQACSASLVFFLLLLHSTDYLRLAPIALAGMYGDRQLIPVGLNGFLRQAARDERKANGESPR